jgi:hypothetical protein
MRKYLLIVPLVSLFCLPVFSQMHPYDSLRIVSLKKKLASLKNSARVDVLLDLAIEYGDWKAKDYLDTLQFYINEAQKLSNSLGYKKGMAYSALLQANLEMYIKKDLDKASALIRTAAKLADEVKDNKLWSGSWASLAALQSSRKDSASNESLKKAFHYAELAGDSQGIAAASAMQCNYYFLRGNYEGAFPNCQACIEKSPKNPIRNPSQSIGWTTLAYKLMAKMYSDAGEYKMAMDLIKRSSKIVEVTHTSGWGEKEMIGELFCKMGNADSALYFLRQDHTQEEIDGITSLSILVGEAYFLKKDYKQANHLFLTATDKLRKMPLNWWISRGLLGLAKTYVATSNFDEAMKTGKEALLFANNNDARVARKDGYELVSDLFYRSGQYDSAYNYLKRFTLLKDSILNQQFLWKLNNYKSQAEKAKKDAEIGFLNRDNQIKTQKLKQGAFVKNSLIAGLILLLFLGLFILRILIQKRKSELQKQQLENEKKQAALQQKTIELEMQALRAQMNPHFIFNCLSSINKFILKNDTDTASDYLTRFSRLIRFGLINSQLSLIPLNDEIEMLRLYLDMERLRFSDSFDYNIIYENTIEPETIYIPPMLLQPFCENAIWHGLMHKEGHGKLEVIMSVKDGQLQCIITDNGIGRQKAAELKTKSGAKQKSFGLKITTERLALFNEEKIIHSFYNTEDLFDSGGNVAGTKVTLSIKFKEAVQQIVKETV